MSGPKEPAPVLTVHLFPELLQSLLESLSALSPDEWAKPVPRKSWTVHDVALHLLGGDVGLLARERDGFVISNISVGSFQELVEALKTLNDTWIAAGRRISPRLLCDLLRFTGSQVSDYDRMKCDCRQNRECSSARSTLVSSRCVRGGKTVTAERVV